MLDDDVWENTDVVESKKLVAGNDKKQVDSKNANAPNKDRSDKDLFDALLDLHEQPKTQEQTKIKEQPKIEVKQADNKKKKKNKSKSKQTAKFDKYDAEYDDTYDKYYTD
jgi:hypothetical protein